LVWAHFFKIPTTQTKVKVGYGGVLGQLKKNQTTKVETIIGLKGASLSHL
jgi:hypothetical protein